MSGFFKHLSEMLNLRPSPPQKAECGFCGGVRCIGACGAQKTPERAAGASGRLPFAVHPPDQPGIEDR